MAMKKTSVPADGIGPCAVCDQEGRDRIAVHPECIPHRHHEPTAPAEPLTQEDHAAVVRALIQTVEACQLVVEGARSVVGEGVRMKAGKAMIEGERVLTNLRGRN